MTYHHSNSQQNISQINDSDNNVSLSYSVNRVLPYQDLKLNKAVFDNEKFVYPGEKLNINNYILQNNIRTKQIYENKNQKFQTQITKTYDNIDFQLDTVDRNNTFGLFLKEKPHLFKFFWPQSQILFLDLISKLIIKNNSDYEIFFSKHDESYHIYKPKKYKFYLSNYSITNIFYEFNILKVDIKPAKGIDIQYIHALDLFPYNTKDIYDNIDNYESNQYPKIGDYIDISNDIIPFFLRDSNTDTSNIKNDNYQGISIYYNHILLKDSINPKLSYDIYNYTYIQGIGGRYNFTKNDLYFDDKNGILGIYNLNNRLAKVIFGFDEDLALLYNYKIENNNIIINKNTKIPPIKFSFFRYIYFDKIDKKTELKFDYLDGNYFNLFNIDITDNNQEINSFIDNNIYSIVSNYKYYNPNATILKNVIIDDNNKNMFCAIITNNHNLLDINLGNILLYFNPSYLTISNIKTVNYIDDVHNYNNGNNTKIYTGFIFNDNIDFSNNIIEKINYINFITIYDNNIPNNYNYVKWTSVVRNLDYNSVYYVYLSTPLYKNQHILTEFNIFTYFKDDTIITHIAKCGFYNEEELNINNYIFFDVSSHILPNNNDNFIHNLKKYYSDTDIRIYYEKECLNLKYLQNIQNLDIKTQHINLYTDNTLFINFNDTISGWIKNDISINTYIIKNEKCLDVSINYICDYSGIIISKKEDINKYTLFNDINFNTLTGLTKIDNIDYYDDCYKISIFRNIDSAKNYIKYKKNIITNKTFLTDTSSIFTNISDISISTIINYDNSNSILFNNIKSTIITISGIIPVLYNSDISFFISTDNANFSYIGNNSVIDNTHYIKVKTGNNHVIFKNSYDISNNLTKYQNNYDENNYIVFYDGNDYYYRKNKYPFETGDNLTFSKNILFNEEQHMYINNRTNFSFIKDGIILDNLNMENIIN